jgi:abortive infection bacteriophage resistance protein
LTDVLERIEIAIRTQIALQLGVRDTLAHRKATYFDKKFVTKYPPKKISRHEKWINMLDEKAANSKEEFADHFRTKYAGCHMPIWIAVELLDFGPTSHLLSGMKYPDLKAIGSASAVPRPELLTTWVRALSGVRNICAHHARLWNKPLVDQPALPKIGEIPVLNHLWTAPHGNRRVYAALAIARYLMRSMNPRTKWQDRLKAHVKTFPDSPHLSITSAGFPADWDQLPLWN